MKTINQFLSELNSLDIKLWAESNPEETSEMRLRCNAPKDVLTPDLKTELAQRKGEILEALLQINLNANPIKPAPQTDRVPLSFAQQRLWFLDRLEPGNPFYNQPAALRMTGELQIPILEQSLREIIRRHEILRTNFATVGSQTFQVIKSEVNFQLDEIDLTSLSSTEKEREVEQLAHQEAEKPFNLEQDLLLRVTLLKCSSKEHIILFTTHHIVSDDWSTGILIQEIATLYQALREEKRSPLPELSIQYADFAIWQRQWLEGKAQSTQLKYWQEQLNSNLTVLNLPTDKPRPTQLTYQGATKSFTLSPALTQDLKALCQREGVTLFMLLLTAFKLLLHRYSHQEDIVVGIPIANRNRGEIEGLIGFFVNTLVLRTNLEGNPSLKELLQKVKQVTLGAYSNQDLPFEKLVEELKPERHLNRNPLFDVMFALQNATESELRLPELTLSSIEAENHTAKFDLSLDMFESDSELSGTFEYSTDLFEPSTIALMVEHFQVLLEAIVTQPETPISQLPLLTKREKQQLLFDWNDNQAEYPVETCIHQLFEEQVNKTPEAIAVVFDRQSLTYRELNQRANQLARCLQNLGLRIGEFVGIYQERSHFFLISILAVLKAGGIYIPLDNAYPSARIEYMISNSQTRFLLVDAECTDIMLDSPQDYVNLKHLISLDNSASIQSNELNILGSESWQHLPTDNLQLEVTGVDPAYIIYTSGSTGKPKGTIIRHGGAINHIYAQYDALKLTQGLSFLQSAPASSDISVWQFLAPILIGGETAIVDKEAVCNPEELWKVTRQSQITLIELVPIVLRGLINYLSDLPIEERELPCLQWMMVTGESASVTLVNDWLKLYPNIPIINAYGPSEASDDITQAIISEPLPENQSTVPIGKPLANLNLYIIDKNQNLVPVGVPGEICVSGYGVGVGYWQNEAKTQASFIPNPFPETAKPLPGVKTDLLYKTGDLGRWLSNGSIEYLGRIDNQVQIRGFRIELGEIEAAIAKYPLIKDCVVNDYQDTAGRKRLAAYYIAEESIDSKQLREYLQPKLPEYMIPSAWVKLELLPQTPNGKCDRNALPIPEIGKLNLEKQFVAPRNEVETQLAAIWAEVLDLERVDIFDNFFDLGGDSILAIMVVTKANQVGLQLRVKQLFQHQTVADLAPVALTKTFTQAEQGIVTGFTPLTPIQQSFFAQENLLEPHHWNQAVLLEVTQTLDLAILEKSIQQLLLHHDALRLQFEPTDSGWRQTTAEPNLVTPLAYLDFSELPKHEQKLAIETSANQLQASLNLTTGSLVRVALFDLGKQESRLLIIIHHLAVDGVSWRILLEDLKTSYQQLSQGKKVQLPAKTTSFKHWSHCLQEYTLSTPLQQEWDYWLEQPWHKATPLPVNFADGDNSVASIRDVSVFLSVEETQALLQEVPQAYNTQINDVLLTALVQAFQGWTNNSTLLLDLEGHGREEISDDVDISRTVGWFTSIFPVLLDLGNISDPIEALKAVKEYLRGIPHKGMNYGVLRYLSNDTTKVESLKSHPQAQVVFNYLGQFDGTFADSSMFQVADDSPGELISSQNHETHMLDINALVIDNRLKIEWAYSEEIHRRNTIQKLADGFIDALQVLIDRCQSPEVGGYTASDFPEAALSQQDLERFLEKIN